MDSGRATRGSCGDSSGPYWTRGPTPVGARGLLPRAVSSHCELSGNPDPDHLTYEIADPSFTSPRGPIFVPPHKTVHRPSNASHPHQTRRIAAHTPRLTYQHYADEAGRSIVNVSDSMSGPAEAPHGAGSNLGGFDLLKRATQRMMSKDTTRYVTTIPFPLLSLLLHPCPSHPSYCHTPAVTTGCAVTSLIHCAFIFLPKQSHL